MSAPQKTITISETTFKEILGNAIVYADYIAGNHNCPVVRSGAKTFSAECEKEISKLK